MPNSPARACWCGKLNCTSHKPKAYVVAGAPGSGKSTYVHSHKGPNDLVFDFDEVMRAITGLPLHHRVEGALDFVMRMRDGFLIAARKDSDIPAVWIITSNPKKQEWDTLTADLRGELIVMDEREDVCIQRTASRGKEWACIIHNWFLRR